LFHQLSLKRITAIVSELSLLSIAEELPGLEYQLNLTSGMKAQAWGKVSEALVGI